MGEAGLDMLYALVLEDGSYWGNKAADFQKIDAEAIFMERRPNWHFLTRPRGGSKTTDIAGIALGWLAVEAPPRARAYVVASNSEQAAELIDAAASLVTRTPELDGTLTIENERIIAPTGAWVRVLAQSDSGAWGKRDAHLLICDEFAQWPDTRGARRVWTAVRTTVQKTPGCRLIILTSAGEPSHWSNEVLAKAKADKANWRVHEVPGPVPWHTKADLDALRRELLPSEYDRLVLNIWSESEERAIAPDDYEMAAEDAHKHDIAPAGLKGGGYRLHHPREFEKYIITVDIGIRNDATVMCVAHKEKTEYGVRVVIDHLERWQGSKRHHVQLEAVEKQLIKLAGEYNRAKVYADPDQFVGSIQRLRSHGLRAEEWVFSVSSVGQVATALVQSFHNRVISVPDTPDLRDELLKVKLKETAPGVTRLDHDRAGHDDQAVAIGMACHLLIGQNAYGAGDAFKQFMADQSAKRPSKEERQRQRDLRQLLKMTTPKRKNNRQLDCQHRWRDGHCVFCPALQGGADANTASSATARQGHHRRQGD